MIINVGEWTSGEDGVAVVVAGGSGHWTEDTEKSTEGRRRCNNSGAGQSQDSGQDRRQQPAGHKAHATAEAAIVLRLVSLFSLSPLSHLSHLRAE